MKSENQKRWNYEYSENTLNFALFSKHLQPWLIIIEGAFPLGLATNEVIIFYINCWLPALNPDFTHKALNRVIAGSDFENGLARFWDR